MENTYYDSAESVKISAKRARYEIVKNHCLTEDDWQLFLEEVGLAEEYDAQTVLNWLGY